jgi:hypothetical protein
MKIFELKGQTAFPIYYLNSNGQYKVKYKMSYLEEEKDGKHYSYAFNPEEMSIEKAVAEFAIDLERA